METWPTSIPRPDGDAFSAAPGPMARRFQPDEGPATQRRFTTASLTAMSLSYTCDWSERTAIFDFWNGGGAGGGAWFNFPHPQTGAGTVARFIADKPPTEVPKAPYWVVTVPLEVYM